MIRTYSRAAIFKYDGCCRKCEQHCPKTTLGEDPFDRHACCDRLLENARLHQRHGCADVCGECAAIVPCQKGVVILN